MSFTGIFKAKDGIVAIVDSKASRIENGQSYEDIQRNPEKLFVFQNGIATTFGANQILVQNPFEFSSKVIAIEDLVYEYLHLKRNISLLEEMKNTGNILIIFLIFHRLHRLMYCRKPLQKNWMD